MRAEVIGQFYFRSILDGMVQIASTNDLNSATSSVVIRCCTVDDGESGRRCFRRLRHCTKSNRLAETILMIGTEKPGECLLAIADRRIELARFKTLTRVV